MHLEVEHCETQCHPGPRGECTVLDLLCIPPCASLYTVVHRPLLPIAGGHLPPSPPHQRKYSSSSDGVVMEGGGLGPRA